MQSGELLEVPHVVEQPAILGTVLVDEGHRGGGRTHAGHGDASFHTAPSAHRVPNMTDEGHTALGWAVGRPPARQPAARLVRRQLTAASTRNVVVTRRPRSRDCRAARRLALRCYRFGSGGTR